MGANVMREGVLMFETGDGKKRPSNSHQDPCEPAHDVLTISKTWKEDF